MSSPRVAISTFRIFANAESSIDALFSYLIELRNISVNQRLLSSALITRMKRTAFLLASRRVKKGGGFADIDDENAEHVYDLLRADQIIVADDTNEYQLFGDAIFCCPQEDLLEGTYRSIRWEHAFTHSARFLYTTGIAPSVFFGQGGVPHK